MQTIEAEFAVPFRYAAHFTENLFDPANPLFATAAKPTQPGRQSKLLAVVDAGVCEHHPGLSASIDAYCAAHPELTLVAPPLVLPGGEAVKNDLRHIDAVHDAIHRNGICRQSFVVAIGGGAVLDAVGYAAATAHRGVRLIRVPTTVLSQNDSGLGVKNSFNCFGKKNFLGTFAPPHAVLNDFAFLRTLSMRDWRSGISEAVKVALIKDRAFFDFIEEHAGALVAREEEPMRRLIHRCAQLHVRHIASAGDPFEQGASRPLDFGHWAAHKLEQMSHFRLRHGEAVALGIALDTTYSRLTGLLGERDCRRIVDLLKRLGFELYAPEMDKPLSRLDRSSLLHGLTEFREHLGGELTIMLLSAIGVGVEVHHMDDDFIHESVAELASTASAAKACVV
jgi:3-dehydroquinate synthase